jgi:RHS repeat-associated protein
MNTRCILSLALLTTSAAAPLPGQSGAAINGEKTNRVVAATAIPNRTLPNVKPPKAGLEFSANPTTQEISRARVFEEPLVPIGGQPSTEENAALAAALLGYAKRSGPDDFSSLTAFLEKHPKSAWRASLLTDLGLEYYNTAHYSLALDAWEKAWPLAKDATDGRGKAIADRAAGELAALYARLGRMTELEALLKSVENRVFVGAATERITGAREGLWNMQNKPEISFKCGPYALQQILKSDQSLLTSAATNARTEIANAASTQKGLSLPQVAELSKKVGLNYQMAFRQPLSRSSTTLSPSDGERDGERGAFIVPSVVHWKVGHYAAMVRREGNRYLLEDPTFGNTVWATRKALEAETSGYFLIPSGELPPGWRSVDAKEGATVWGRGQPPGSDPDPTTPDDDQEPPDCPGDGEGMAVARVHLMLVSLNIVDTPVGYSPPVGPPVRFTVRYNQRDANQPANFTYSNFGPKWTCDWISYITDNPSNALANAKYYARGGGARTFTGADTNTQTFAFQQYDQTRLTRIGPSTYEMTSPSGSKMIFGQPDGSIGLSRKIFLTQIVDPFGNAITLTYDVNLRIVAITDAIGQVTTLSYSNATDIYKITRVTDPFGRFADFAYDSLGRLTNITDVIGLNSRFIYSGSGDFINSLVTPYGTNTFIAAQGGGPHGTTRSLETHYPDGSRDRVEYNQSENLGISSNDPPAIVPVGMETFNRFLFGRNTYYWSRTACASAYGDYTKAKIYHWLHAENVDVASGILESTKEALENRVWYNYAGQGGIIGAGGVGTSSRPTKVGRVLDDGTTQLYTYAYDGFGHMTNSIDPVGRTFSYFYASNGIDLLEVRQTRAGNNELLSRRTYNAQHLPLTTTDAAGQTTTFTYNARGQRLTETNPKGETTSFTYDTNGYLIAVDGPLPGTNDTVTMTYDALGRTLTKTDESGYTVTFEHDDMDRLTKITHPDSTFSQFTFDRLDVVTLRDRAGRQTLFEFDSLQQMKKRTDPLGRVTLFDWCRCGDIKSLTDPMGRTTSWLTDVQGRAIAKQYGDGSQVKYLYENASSRLKQVIDEKQQITQFTWKPDNTLKSEAYANAVIPTHGVSYTYDPNYRRLLSMTDGTGNTLYSYNPITGISTLGAGALASVDGPLPNDTITYSYDQLGRAVFRAINGVSSAMSYDAAGRLVGVTNALGAFVYAYDRSSGRLVSKSLPNGQTAQMSYGNLLQDLSLQRITHRVGATPISEFIYGHDVAADRIATWSQQAGAQPPSLHNFGYDAADQLLSATVTNSGTLVNAFAYTYDFAANRLTEQVGASNFTAIYNALNQLSTSTAPGASRTNEWDAKDRLVAVNVGNQRTEFTYDGLGKMVSIRQLTNGSEASFRRFVWCDNQLCEERDATGVVTKRFFDQGMKVEAEPNAGSYYYTRDHLGSIRELTDAGGNVRARYAYAPYGRRTKLMGDVEADFGFTGLFFANESGLSAARFRMYDAEAGRWLSRDPLRKAEFTEGPNLYAYVGNNPINATDPLGLMQVKKCCDELKEKLEKQREVCNDAKERAYERCNWAYANVPEVADEKCAQEVAIAKLICHTAEVLIKLYASAYYDCMMKGCEPPDQCPSGGGGGGGGGGDGGHLGDLGGE